MNFSASMALSILLHSAVAVVVIAAPPVDEEPARMLDEFVETRHVVFQPEGFATPEPEPEPEPAVQKEPEQEKSAPEPKPKPEPEPEPEVEEPEPAQAPEPEPKPEPEPEPEPKPEPKKAEVKAVVASKDSESPAEVTEAASAEGGVTNGRPDGEPGARASDRKDTGTGTPTSTDSGSDGVDRRALLRAWLKKIYVQVYRHQRYPRAAQRARQQGKVVVKAWIAPSGKVTRTTIADSSGHATLDRAARELIEMLSPVPKPPHALRWKTRPIKIPVTYRLR